MYTTEHLKTPFFLNFLLGFYTVYILKTLQWTTRTWTQCQGLYTDNTICINDRHFFIFSLRNKLFACFHISFIVLQYQILAFSILIEIFSQNVCHCCYTNWDAGAIEQKSFDQLIYEHTVSHIVWPDKCTTLSFILSHLCYVHLYSRS